MYTHFLLIDGYNIIYAWDNLKKIAESSLEDARDKLIFIMSNYQGYKHIGVIIVFDAYKVKGGAEVFKQENGIGVVFTKEAETADSYIERTALKYRKKYTVSVATSDNLEQIIILSKGAYRISARELYLDVKNAEQQIKKKLSGLKPIKNNQLFDNLDPKTAEIIEKMRFDKK